jgi:hypothetical protein
VSDAATAEIEMPIDEKLRSVTTQRANSNARSETRGELATEQGMFMSANNPGARDAGKFNSFGTAGRTPAARKT